MSCRSPLIAAVAALFGLASLAAPAALAADEPTAGELRAMTEAECQEIYQLSCERVRNWKKYALEACGSRDRCDDPDYLDRKYRPRPVADILAVAHRAGTRKNRTERRITEILRNKYTNICHNNLKLYCNGQSRHDSARYNQCLSNMESSCEEPRSFEDILAQYDDLSPAEKRQYLDKAKQLTLASGKDSLDYDEILASLIELLITQATMGL